MFFRMLADRAISLLPEPDRAAASDAALAAAIWDLVWAGRVSNDTLAALRTVLSTGRPMAPDGGPPATARHPRAERNRTLRAGPGQCRANGAGLNRSGPTGPRLGGPPPRRWPDRGRLGARRRGPAARPCRAGPGHPPCPAAGSWCRRRPGSDQAAARGGPHLLDRHGILIRGAVATERVPGGFAAIYPVLRAMEDAGQCRRGYFVEGLGAAQFALPGAVDRMRAMAADAEQGEPGERADPWSRRPGDGASWHQPARPAGPSPVVLAAGDPANPFGAALPWPDRPDETPGGHRPGRKAGALVVLAHGQLVLYVERGGKTVLSWTSDPAVLGPAAAALASAARSGALGRLTIERADGDTVHASPLAHALEEAGFRATPRGLRLRR